MEQTVKIPLDIESLPEEIFLQVLTYLPLTDLYNLCFVSRSFRKCATDYSLQLRDKLYDQALVHVDRQDYDAALETLSRLLKIFPTDYRAFQERAFSWQDKGFTVNALLDLRAAEKYCTDEAFRHFIYSHCYWAKGNNEKAYEEISTAIKINPANPRFYHFRGFLQSTLAKGRDDTVSQELEMNDYLFIEKNHPNYKRIAVVYNNMGFVYYDQMKLDQAVALFTKSISLCSYHVRAHYNRALVYAEQGFTDLALQDSETILKINPKISEVWTLRGWCHTFRGDYEKAIDAYKIALERIKTEPYVMSALFSLLTQLGHLERGIEETFKFEELMKVEYQKIMAHRRKVEELQKKVPITNIIQGMPMTEDTPLYIDPFRDVIRKEKEYRDLMARTLRRNGECCLSHGFRYRSEFQFLMGQLQDAKTSYQKYYEFAEARTAPYLDFVFSKDFSTVHPLTILNVSDILRTCNSPGMTQKLIERLEVFTKKHSLSVFVLPTLNDIVYWISAISYKYLNFQLSADDDAELVQVLKQFVEFIETEAKSNSSQGFFIACHYPQLLFRLFKIFLTHDTIPPLVALQLQVLIPKSSLSTETLRKINNFLKQHQNPAYAPVNNNNNNNNNNDNDDIINDNSDANLSENEEGDGILTDNVISEDDDAEMNDEHHNHNMDVDKNQGSDKNDDQDPSGSRM